MNQYEILKKQLDLNPDFNERYQALSSALQKEYQEFVGRLLEGNLADEAWLSCSQSLYDCDLINASCKACYPISGQKTAFKVSIPGVEEVYAMCAFDAMCFLSLKDSEIICLDGTRITRENLQDVPLKVWVPNAKSGCCVASKSCSSIKFIAKDDVPCSGGVSCTLPEAFVLSVQLFDYALDVIKAKISVS